MAFTAFGIGDVADAHEAPLGMEYVAVPPGVEIHCHTDGGLGLVYGRGGLAGVLDQAVPSRVLNSREPAPNSLALRGGPGLHDEEFLWHHGRDDALRPGLDGVPDPLLLCDGTPETCPTTQEQIERGWVHQCTGVLGQPWFQHVHEVHLVWAASYTMASMPPMEFHEYPVELSDQLMHAESDRIFTYGNYADLYAFQDDPASLPDDLAGTDAFRAYCFGHYEKHREAMGMDLDVTLDAFRDPGTPIAGEGRSVAQLMTADHDVMRGIFASFLRTFHERIELLQCETAPQA